MSKTKKGSKPPGYDYSSKRGRGWMTPGKLSKRLAAVWDRLRGKQEIREESEYDPKEPRPFGIEKEEE
jgi:hypothetical protein